VNESSVKRLPLRHQIKEAIIERIVAGKLRSGDRLVEMKIAAEFGTSQAPVREALRELEAIGFLSATPHRGAFVRDFWRQGLKEFYAVRGALEESATRQAMPMQEADLQKLENELEAMHAAAMAQNLDGIAKHSVAFHEIIVKAAHNELLYTVWKSLCIDSSRRCARPIAPTRRKLRKTWRRRSLKSASSRTFRSIFSNRFRVRTTVGNASRSQPSAACCC